MSDHSRTHVMWLLNAKFTVAARAVVLDEANRALLVRGAADEAWQLPRVYLRRRDVPEDAISQAIEERTGVVAHSLIPVVIEASAPPHLEVLYAGRAIAGDGAAPAGAWRWCETGDLPLESAAAVRTAIASMQALRSPADVAPARELHLAAR